jgi:hypothetical protein
VIGTPAAVVPSAGEMLQDKAAGGGLAACTSTGPISNNMPVAAISTVACCMNRFSNPVNMVIDSSNLSSDFSSVARYAGRLDSVIPYQYHHEKPVGGR